MTREQDWAEFVSLWQIAADASANIKQDEALARAPVHFKMLAQYPFEQVFEAVMHHCKSNKFFPMPADIITLIEGYAEDNACLAWATVQRMRESFGTWYTVQFSDPCVHYAIQQMGGWIKISEMPDDDFKFCNKEFIALYLHANRLGLTWGHHQIPIMLEGYYWCESRAKYGDRITDLKVFPPAKRLLPDGCIQEVSITDIGLLPMRQQQPALIGDMVKKLVQTLEVKT